MHSAQQMYDIVADIETYPEFLQWCHQATVLQQDNDIVVAKVDIKFKGIDQSFTTKNINKEGISIEMGLHDDADTFEYLSGGWYFTPIEVEGKQACKVAFDLDRLKFLAEKEKIKLYFGQNAEGNSEVIRMGFGSFNEDELIEAVEAFILIWKKSI